MGDDKSCRLEDLPKEKHVELNIKKGLALFNGNSGHCVNDFKGTRFSVVYFTLGCHAKMGDENRASLEALGVRVPAIDEDPRALLRAPRGYGGGPATSIARDGPEKPTVCFWPSSELERMPLKLGNSASPRPVATPSSRSSARAVPTAKQTGQLVKNGKLKAARVVRTAC